MVVKSPKRDMIRLSPYQYACDLCGKEGYKRVYMGVGGCKELAVCINCVKAAVAVIGLPIPSEWGR